MATKKPAAKPAAKKPAPKKAVATPIKKAAVPAKKQAKPVAKPAAKPVAKKAAPKPAPKAAPKKAVAKPVAKPAAKKVVAPVKAKAVPVKSVPAKTAKPVVSPASKKPVAVQKPAQKPMAKKVEEKKPVAKPAAKPAVPAKAAVAEKAVPKKEVKAVAPKPVVIPKINHKTARKYQPEFTKSVLDQVKNDPGAPITRYNDADLAEFKELIQRKMNAAKKELNYLQGLITRKDEMGGDESDNRYMTMEDGSLSMEREQLSQMASRQITFIDHLDKALMRIENKTYGICRVTGKLIDKARLRAVPHATLSIEAKMGIVK
ncbi:MAG: TraR/DksA family transcriptional regulator [Ferruginibacter sp.]|nr:TraR/DksA family transcriptional regulator [Ferruginibacter sp.]